MSTETRSSLFEIWSAVEGGGAQMHGSAYGVTFADACKHLASESVDFWTHYDKGRYRGRRLWSSEREALAAGGGEAVGDK